METGYLYIQGKWYCENIVLSTILELLACCFLLQYSSKRLHCSVADGSFCFCLPHREGEREDFAHEIVAGILIFFPPETDFLHEMKNSNSSLGDPSKWDLQHLIISSKNLLNNLGLQGKSFTQNSEAGKGLL